MSESEAGLNKMLKIIDGYCIENELKDVPPQWTFPTIFFIFGYVVDIVRTHPKM